MCERLRVRKRKRRSRRDRDSLMQKEQTRPAGDCQQVDMQIIPPPKIYRCFKGLSHRSVCLYGVYVTLG